MDASEHFLAKINITFSSFVTALSNSNFYIALFGMALVICLGYLFASLLRKRLVQFYQQQSKHSLFKDIAIRGSSLLSPLMTLILFTGTVPLINEMSGNENFTQAIVKLTLSLLIAKFILLVVHSRAVAYLLATLVMLSGLLHATGFMKPTLTYLSSISFNFGHVEISLLNIINGIIILVLMFWIARAVSHTLEHYLRRSSSLSYSTRELIVKLFKVFIYFVALIITLSAVGIDLTVFAVFGGALGVGIGLGLQKLTANFLSGIALLVEESIKIGDLLEVGNTLGWVRQLNIRYVLLETFDGREILIPNEELFSSRVTNWTYSNDKARIEVKVTITYDSDVRLAQKLMMEAAHENSMILKDQEPVCTLNEFADFGINMRITFWIPDIRIGRVGPQSDVMIAILDKFKANGIKIAIKA